MPNQPARPFADGPRAPGPAVRRDATPSSQIGLLSLCQPGGPGPVVVRRDCTTDGGSSLGDGQLTRSSHPVRSFRCLLLIGNNRVRAPADHARGRFTPPARGPAASAASDPERLPRRRVPPTQPESAPRGDPIALRVEPPDLGREDRPALGPPARPQYLEDPDLTSWNGRSNVPFI